jgi:phosphonate transport system ATP-binding protein
VLGLLRSICKQDGITAIVSLHHLEFARNFADRIVGIADSTVVFDDAPSELDDVGLARIYGRKEGPRASDWEQKIIPPAPIFEPTMEMSL